VATDGSITGEGVHEEKQWLRMGNFVVSGVEKRDDDVAGEKGGGVPTVVVYIGDEGAELTRLMLENVCYRFLVFNPKVGSEGGGIVSEDSLVDSARALKRRYFLMMKAKDAERIGIVVATTAVEGYSAMVQRLKTVIRTAGKRPYVFYVGKINPAKLANFAEMDALVLVASPETCAAVDAADYWKPLITPMECEVALVKGRSWTGHYDFDFRPLLATPLPEARLRPGGSEGDSDDGDITHSLTSGTLTVRSAGTVMALSAGEVMMATRTFKGLDVNEGLERSLDLVQGRVGIASGYSHEPSATSNQLHHTHVTDGTRVPSHMRGHASSVNYGVEGDQRVAVTQGSRRSDGGKIAVAGESTESPTASTGEGGAASWMGGGTVEEADQKVESDGDNDMQQVADDVDDFFALLNS